MRYVPGGTESMRKRPAESVTTRLLRPSTETSAPANGPPRRLSATTPRIDPNAEWTGPSACDAGTTLWLRAGVPAAAAQIRASTGVDRRTHRTSGIMGGPRGSDPVYRPRELASDAPRSTG